MLWGVLFKLTHPVLVYSLGSEGLLLVVLSWLDDTLWLGVPIRCPTSKSALIIGTRTSAGSSAPTVNCTMVRSRLSKSLSSPLSSRQMRMGAGPPSLPSSPLRWSTLSRWRLGLPGPLHWDTASFLFLFCWDSIEQITSMSVWVHQTTTERNKAKPSARQEDRRNILMLASSICSDGFHALKHNTQKLVLVKFHWKRDTEESDVKFWQRSQAACQIFLPDIQNFIHLSAWTWGWRDKMDARFFNALVGMGFVWIKFTPWWDCEFWTLLCDSVRCSPNCVLDQSTCSRC